MIGVQLVVGEIGVLDRIEHAGWQLAELLQPLGSVASLDEAVGVLEFLDERVDAKRLGTSISARL